MTEETEISTPVDGQEEVTSEIVEPETNSVTSTDEPSNDNVTAEMETKKEVATEQRLYAGKYKDIETFEKSHNELYGAYTKAKENENKYKQLLKEQEEKAEKIAQQKREQAQQYGYRSPEEQEIDKHVKLAEYQYYAQNLNEVTDADQLQEVNTLLSNYYATGHKAYLDEAKSYFPIHFIEQVSNATHQTK